jgi:hypothetical protein
LLISRRCISIVVTTISYLFIAYVLNKNVDLNKQGANTVRFNLI